MKIDNTIAAVVTGGASGLGKASAIALSSAGAKVAIFDINAEAGEKIAKEIGGIFCKVDITSEESAIAGFEKARAAHGQERVLVHCAMTARRGKTLAFDKDSSAFKRTPT
jgi:NAD(P)-dependent dehydrogenase (short-subunit alcohol dehydrogenase family)